MADNDPVNQAGELVAAPLSALIAAIGKGLAEAQQAMDLSTIETLKALYSGDNPQLDLMRQFGYQPTWYRIPELDAEVTVSLSIGAMEGGAGGGPGGSALKLYAAPVDANYSNRYAFDLKAASTVRFKVVPVPAAPAAADLKIVPRLKDRPWAKARQLLEELAIPYRMDSKLPPLDTKEVAATTPGEGEVLKARQQVLIRLK
jgi:hypothetical protein